MNLSKNMEAFGELKATQQEWKQVVHGDYTLLFLRIIYPVQVPQE